MQNLVLYGTLLPACGTASNPAADAGLPTDTSHLSAAAGRAPAGAAAAPTAMDVNSGSRAGSAGRQGPAVAAAGASGMADGGPAAAGVDDGAAAGQGKRAKKKAVRSNQRAVPVAPEPVKDEATLQVQLRPHHVSAMPGHELVCEEFWGVRGGGGGTGAVLRVDNK